MIASLRDVELKRREQNVESVYRNWADWRQLMAKGNPTDNNLICAGQLLLHSIR